MTPRNTNAFPLPSDWSYEGLTRREYYAAHALPAVIEKLVAFYAVTDPRFATGVAEACAKIGDAMVAELEK